MVGTRNYSRFVSWPCTIDSTNASLSSFFSVVSRGAKKN